MLLAEGNKSSGAAASANTKSTKAAKPSQKLDTAAVAVSEKKGGERPLEKERKKEVPQPRMQYDDKSRVDKAKRRAVVKQTEARNRVELFRHLPQYEHGSQLPNLEAKFFQLDPMHPAVYKVLFYPTSRSHPFAIYVAPPMGTQTCYSLLVLSDYRGTIWMP